MFQDQDGISYPNGLGWSSSLAYGAELRVAGIGYPAGWFLMFLEVNQRFVPQKKDFMGEWLGFNGMMQLPVEYDDSSVSSPKR